MIVQPEQYEINKMTKGDIVFVIKRPLWYRLLRKYVLLDKEVVKVKQDIDSDKYNTYYREDCILIFKYELICTETYNNLDYYITKSGKTNPLKKNLKSLTINLYNMQLLLDNGTSITVPLDKIKQGIKNTEQMLKDLNREEIIESQVKFMRYKGDYFKNIVMNVPIRHINFMYCAVCGKPAIFRFKKDSIDVINKCDCGNSLIDNKTISYNDFAVWFASQTDDMYKTRLLKLMNRE